MDKFYVILTDSDFRDKYLASLRKNSLLMLQELAKEAPQPMYGMDTFATAIYCTGVWVNQAIQSILIKEQVGKKLRYLALRDDGRILDVDFTAVIAPHRLNARIV